jgi:hypothetical protein
MSTALEGKPFTEEHLTNLRAAHAARRKSKVPKPKVIRTVGYGTGIRDPNKPHGNLGKKKTDEHRDKLSQARTLNWIHGTYDNRTPKATV